MSKAPPNRIADPVRSLSERLETLYHHYNDRRWIHPDPLETVIRYDDPRDQEIAGLIAASLAFGGVKQIIGSIDSVLDRMGSPYAFLTKATHGTLRKQFAGFRHRYVTDVELVALLFGMKGTLAAYGTLEACFVQGVKPSDESYRPALSHLVQHLLVQGRLEKNYLLPIPERGSACKRLHLYLRWMIRQDAVDPGPWRSVSPKGLLIPVDTHMHRIARCLGWTRRNQADGATSLEITNVCRSLVPEDPVRYDFALTRIGIRKDFTLAEFVGGDFVKACGANT